MRVLLSTDTSCLINYEALNNYPISVFNLNVIIDNVEFLDGISIKQDSLLEAMNNNKTIKTSTPPLGLVIDYFEKLFEKGYDHIIHFTISSKLSSMYNLFTSVANEYFEGKLTIIDSYSLSTLMLSHVFYAYDELNKSTPIEEIVKGVEARKLQNLIAFIPKNLTTLKNGGRISPALAAIGNTIGLKPVILLKDGELVKDSMTRSIKKAFNNIINDNISKLDINNFDYTIVDFDGDENIVQGIIDDLKSHIGENNLIRGLIPINVCAHCGPGSIGIVISPKINKKSLKEFLV